MSQDKQGREIHNQDKTILGIETVNTELFDSDQSTCPIIYTDPKEVTEITPRKVAAVLRDVRESVIQQRHKRRDIKTKRRYRLKDTPYTVL